MIPKSDNNPKMYHLSYDKKNQDEDSEKLREQLIWAILGMDLKAEVKSPVESTIVFESHIDYESWESMFQAAWVKKIYYVLSQVAEDRDFYLIDIEENAELSVRFIEKVKSMRAELIRNRKLSQL